MPFRDIPVLLFCGSRHHCAAPIPAGFGVPLPLDQEYTAALMSFGRVHSRHLRYPHAIDLVRQGVAFRDAYQKAAEDLECGRVTKRERLTEVGRNGGAR